MLRGVWSRLAMAVFVVVAVVVSMAVVPTSAPARAQTSGTIHGFADTHTHLGASQAFGGALRCGEPFAPGGLAEAMADCNTHSGTGHFALLESILGGTDLPGGTQGFPTFVDWPSHDSQLHEQAYYTGIERAWQSGLRVLNNYLVGNRVLCETLAGIGVPPRYSCNEMDQLRRQVDHLNRMEAHIDAEHGGPGQGWFRIARSPQEVREIAAQGKLAVTLGVETSEPFDCRQINDVPQCSREDIDRGLEEFASWGVSTVFPVHKFDNALGGARMDEELAGLAVNVGNKLGTQRFWETEPCEGAASDHAQPIASTPVADGLAAATSGAPDGAALPIYPGEPICNVRGLTELGEYAVNGMMDRGMLINIDHMSVKTAGRVLDIATERGYPGFVVDHSWSDPSMLRRMHELGGFVGAFAYPADATENFDEGFLDEWRANSATVGGTFSGYGIGSDVNGLAPLAEPRPTAATDPLVYPFTAPSGEVMDRWQFGERVYDLNVDGVAQYGLYADWIADVLHRAGPDRAELERQLMNGAEAWTATWEAAR
ncbi:MAG TPA: dipeptidase [Candidatus Dietzia merdigallinarum]|nr:dipeptidase [Candidatus Dietzia merdigallinarum]